MIRNYIITSYRFIVKSKTYTLLNLAGLVVGLMASFILLIFTTNELSYDRYHRNESRTYRILTRDAQGNLFALSPFNFGPSFKNHMDGIDTMARIACPAFLTGSVMVRGFDVFREEPSFYCADPSFLKIFDVEMVKGNPDSCLSGNHAVIISDEAARKYFGLVDPVGRILTVKTAGLIYDLSVTGVFRSFPWNSTLKMDFISGIDLFPEIIASLFDSSEVQRVLNLDPIIETFVLLDPGVGLGNIQGQLPYYIRNYTPWFEKTSLSFQRLRDIYLGSEHINDQVHKKGNRSSMYIYLSLALFVLFLAGINYSILSTARSALRHKEIGVRKVLGASRTALSGQVLTESVLLTFLSFPISYLLLGLIESLLQKVLGYRVEVYSSDVLLLLPLFAGITLFIGLISGTYIAFYLSSLNPIEALKNKLASHKKINLSRIFTVFQLLITISLMIAVITIYRQVNFCINSDLGIEKKNLAIISFDPNEFREYQKLKTEIAKIPGVLSVSGSSIMPPDIAIPTMKIRIPSSDKDMLLESIKVDTGFFRTMGIPFIAGSDFNPADSTGSISGIIVNQKATQVLRIPPDVSKARFGGTAVIGIVGNFNVHTMHDSINPTIFSYQPGYVSALVMRYKEGNRDQVIPMAETCWKQLAPGQECDLREFNEELNTLYHKEKAFGFVVGAFAVLAFIIMGMGLFGLALLISERKTKETAIRKVFGATNSNILFGMQKEFLVYTLIASAIAIPLTIVLLRIWLNTFYYRVSMSWWIFVLSVVAVLGFVSFIILTRTLRVLKENPVKALKYE